MSTRRPKSVLDQDRYTAELSTGQLVIGVCILLMFGLGCFLLGVLIGKFDPTLKNKAGQIAADLPATRAPEVKVAEAPPPTPATTPTEQPPELRAPARILAQDSAVAASTTPTPAADSQARPVPLSEVSAPAVGESVQAAAERNRVAPPSAQPKAVSAAPTPAATTPPKPAPAAPTTKPAPSAAAPKTAASSTKASSPPAVAGEGWKGYGVQVVAVARERADAALKTLQSKTSYKGRVLAHTRTDIFRVVVGPYADQAAAMKARDDLRAKGYKDAFVLSLK